MDTRLLHDALIELMEKIREYNISNDEILDQLKQIVQGTFEHHHSFSVCLHDPSKMGCACGEIRERV